MLPLNNGTIIEENVVNNNTYLANSKGLIHVTNGQAGNIESHSELDGDPRLSKLQQSQSYRGVWS